MLNMNVHTIFRMLLGGAVAIAFAASAQLAQAQAPGALTQLASPNNCIQATGSDSNECPTTAGGLSGSQDTVVSPDGKNVYVASVSDDAITEFERNANGSLTTIGCIADASDGGSSCPNQTATGLVDPEAIAISPDGQNVYVAASLSDENGDVAEFTRNPDGTLTPVSGSDCIQESEEEEGGCDTQGGDGLSFPVALAVSPDGTEVYVADEGDEAVTALARASDGSLSEPNGSHDCIEDSDTDSDECFYSADGISNVDGVAVSPDGDNVYTTGAPGDDSEGSIAEFSTQGDGGPLTWIGCLGNPEGDESCEGGDATGVVGITGLVISPDGNNVYTASEEEGGPIAEFARGDDGTLSQLSAPNNCIEEEGDDFGCDTSGIGIGDGYRLAISPDGANVYAAGPDNPCFSDGGCSDVAEFARGDGGSLSQLPSPDSCIQDEGADGSECPNENGTGLGGPGLAISPDGNNLYVTGEESIAEFARGTHTLTASLAGSGSGAVSDGTGAIACPSTCSHAYTTDSAVTLTATPASGSTFTGWSGACSGTGACQVTMNADLGVTATFTASGPPAPGAPSPVITGAPTAVTDSGAGFTGSANPEGLPTTAYFQYGLDKRYSQVGASGPNYTAQTPAQSVGSDFSTHGVGPVFVSGLVPNAIYHVRLVASNADGTTYGPDVTFKTAHGPEPGPPTLGKTFNIGPVSGLVLIYRNGQFIPLTEETQIGPGTVLDALHGTFELTIAIGSGPGARDAVAKGKTQHGAFGGAVVRIHQATGGSNKGLATVMMVESAYKGAPSQAICRAPGSASDAHAAKLNTKVIQLLHASGHGKFATSGRYSAATVRGTVWDTIARCDGTLVRAIKDEVAVTDFIRHKTILLHAGQSYLAPGP